MCANCRPKHSHKLKNKKNKNFATLGGLNSYVKSKFTRKYLKNSTYGSSRINSENLQPREYDEGEPIKKIRKENDINEFSLKTTNDYANLIDNDAQIQDHSQSLTLIQDDTIKKKLETIMSKNNCLKKKWKPKILLNSNDNRYSTIDSLLNQYGNNLIHH